MRGKFVTIEGIEGTGKSTIRPFIEDFLQKRGYSVYVTREPGGTQVAEAIRSVLLNTWDEELLPQTELLLMFASRAQHVANVIQPKLESGTWVVSERFTDASMAYQGGGRGIPSSFITTLAELAHGYLWPDLTIYLDIDVDTSMSRTIDRSKDRIELEDIEFFNRVRDMYRELADKEPRIVSVDATRSLGEVKKEVSRLIEAMTG